MMIRPTHARPRHAASSFGPATILAVAFSCSAACTDGLQPDEEGGGSVADTTGVEQDNWGGGSGSDAGGGTWSTSTMATAGSTGGESGTSGGNDGDCTHLDTLARGVLEQTCHACHGREGVLLGGLDILDIDNLIATRKIDLDNIENSTLLRRIESVGPDVMPPPGVEPRPDAVAVGQLRQWMACLAADTDPDDGFVPASMVQAAIRSDLLGMPALARTNTRYLSLVHLYNEGATAQQLADHRAGVDKLLTSLSWAPEPYRAQAVAVDGLEGLLLRVDLEALRWRHEPATLDDARLRAVDGWEDLLRVYPYGVPVAEDIGQMTGSRLAVMNADWFVNAASRAPLYYDLLALPASLDEFMAMFGIDMMSNVRDGRVLRAGFNDSGVSQNNRLIERHELGVGWPGACWTSYDFDSNVGDANLFSRPIHHHADPNLNFRHAGGETFCNLPNGAQVYYLSEQDGGRIDVGPIDIVRDDRDPELHPGRAVVNGVSCIRCHANGIIGKGDQLRAVVEADASKYPADVLAYVRGVHEPDEVIAAQQADAELFLAAMRAIGIEVDVTSDPVANLAVEQLSPVSAGRAAAELGIRESGLLALVEANGGFNSALGPFRTGANVARAVWLAQAPQLICDIGLSECPPDACGKVGLECPAGQTCIETGPKAGSCTSDDGTDDSTTGEESGQTDDDGDASTGTSTSGTSTTSTSSTDSGESAGTDESTSSDETTGTDDSTSWDDEGTTDSTSSTSSTSESGSTDTGDGDRCDGELSFDDPKLELAIRKQLSIPADPLTWNDVRNLTQIKYRAHEIVELGGLECLKSLWKVDLVNNLIVDIRPLGELPKLREIDINYNPIADISPLTKLDLLTRLVLGDNEFRDITPIAQMEQIEFLSLYNLDIEDISVLEGLEDLQWLGIGGNPVSDLSPLEGKLALTDLIASDTLVNDLSVIPSMPWLDRLILARSRIVDLAPLLDHPSLRYVEVRGNQGTMSCQDQAANIAALDEALDDNTGNGFFHDCY